MCNRSVARPPQRVCQGCDPADLVPLARKGQSVQSFRPEQLLEVGTATAWTEITGITATRRRATDPDHRLLSIEARGGVVEVTTHHRMLDDDREVVRAREVAARIADCPCR